MARLGLDERIDVRTEGSLGKRLMALERQLDSVQRMNSSRASLDAKAPGSGDLETRIGFVEREVKTAVQKAERAHQRLNQTKLFGEPASVGEPYGCGGRDVQDIPYVMVGLRDGTGCGIQSINHYRKLTLAIPQE
jgi:hypothetical protein